MVSKIKLEVAIAASKQHILRTNKKIKLKKCKLRNYILSTKEKNTPKTWHSSHSVPMSDSVPAAYTPIVEKCNCMERCVSLKIENILIYKTP